VAQRVGRGIALLFHDCGTGRGWVVSSRPRPHFTPGKDPVPIFQEVVWAPGPVWTGEKSRPHRDSIPDRPALSQSLYRLSYPAHYQLHLLEGNVFRRKRTFYWKDSDVSGPTGFNKQNPILIFLLYHFIYQNFYYILPHRAHNMGSRVQSLFFTCNFQQEYLLFLFQPTMHNIYFLF